jgi:hypothetical protein
VRWPWTKRSATDAPPASDDVQEATEARQAAEEALMRSQEQTAEVRDLAAKLRQHRRVNHFAELFHESFGGPR